MEYVHISVYLSICYYVYAVIHLRLHNLQY